MSVDREALSERYWKLRWRWQGFFDTDPNRAIAMIEEAIEIAKTLDEPIWEMESRHWLAQVVIFHKRDYDRGLVLAVESAVEARKPIYNQWSTRVCLYQDLIAAYVGNDPISHADTIEAALDRMQAEAAPNSSCACCLEDLRAVFEMRRNNLEEASHAARKEMSISTFSHYRSQAHSQLAAIAFVKNQWPTLLEHAEAAEKTGRVAGNSDIVISALMWQAVAHLQLDDSEEAQRWFGRSESQRQLYGGTLDDDYWAARVAYFEFGGDRAAAVAARQEHLASIDGHGALREEALALLDLCRLEKQQGQLTGPTVEKTRAAIAALKIPGDLPERLDRLLSDPPKAAAGRN